jgi:hypothetical protein
MRPPLRAVVSNQLIGGYRGHQTRYVGLECGHYLVNRWNPYFGRERGLVPGRSKCRCWECLKNLRKIG